MTKPTKKKKFTLADLKPVQTRIEITHPTHGSVDCWIEVKPPQSLEYMEAFFEQSKLNFKDMSLAEKLKATAALPASVVVAWNEEFFGMPCTKENVIEVLSSLDNAWILLSLNKELEKAENFYKKN